MKLRSNIIALVLLFMISTAYGATSTCSTQTICNPNVFNWRFYLDSNADLLTAGIKSKVAAENHWMAHGIYEGRQAHPTFHTLEYLSLYPDLQTAFGTNYVAALTHYITNGMQEGRKGFAPGLRTDSGVNLGRLTISNGSLSVSVSNRQAGAIDSIMWNNKEFVNATDHGREVQQAVVIPIPGTGEFNNFKRGECNPTEAGSEGDYYESTTTSKWNHSYSLNNIATTNTPAYFLSAAEAQGLGAECEATSPAPGQTEAFNINGVYKYSDPHDPKYATDPTQAKTRYTALSNFKFSKNVQLGYAGLNNLIRYDSAVDLPQYSNPSGLRQYGLAVEIVTGYLGGEFSEAYLFDPTSDTSEAKLVGSGIIDDPKYYNKLPEPTCAESNPSSDTSAAGCHVSLPVIFATKDVNGDYAMGVWSPTLPPTGIGSNQAYGFYLLNSGNSLSYVEDNIDAASKWSVTSSEPKSLFDVASPIKNLSYTTYIAVGTKADVKTTLRAIYKKWAKNTLPGDNSNAVCSLAVSPTNVLAGASATYTLTATGLPAGALTYWNGTKNGVVDAVDQYAGAAPGQYTYANSVGIDGLYARQATIKNALGQTVCTTNSVTVQFQPPTCSLSVNQSNVPFGSTATYTINGTGLAGTSTYWNGTRNGVVDAVNQYAGAAPGQYMYSNSVGTDGVYVRSATIKNIQGQTVCTTNNVTVQHQLPPPSCSLSVNKTSVAVGGSVTFSVTGNYLPAGATAYWNGTNNGSSDAINQYAGAAPSQFTYSNPGGSSRNYYRYAVIKNAQLQPVCQTNSVNVTFLP